MDDYRFNRRTIEERDGSFWLTFEIDEQQRPTVWKRKVAFSVPYDTRAEAEKAKEAWTDERLKKLAPFF
ncbi:MAG: hypothetical protein KF850_19990 [Labilithrix sp.]|nr:hypothetical protein [Labilithrix sp.]